MRGREILRRAQATMRALRSMRQRERLTSGPGSFAATEYRLEAPDRFSYATNSGAQSVVIGTRQWSRTRGEPGREDRYGGGGPGFTTRSWFTWTSYAQEVRLLAIEHTGGGSIARLALMSPGTPLWYRLTVDLSTFRVTRVRMIAGAHFMSQRLYAFNEPLRIEAPRHIGHINKH